jgi:hypothetical protein
MQSLDSNHFLHQLAYLACRALLLPGDSARGCAARKPVVPTVKAIVGKSTSRLSLSSPFMPSRGVVASDKRRGEFFVGDENCALRSIFYQFQSNCAVSIAQTVHGVELTTIPNSSSPTLTNVNMGSRTPTPGRADRCARRSATRINHS